MNKYILNRLVRLNGDTILLSLKPRKTRDRLSYFPGQYVAIGFKNAYRPTPMRCFSIVSSPNDQNLELAVKVQGYFTLALADLKTGNEVFILGPFGEFVIDETLDREVVMLAGGIGVTPFISMIKEATERRSELPMTLLYSCRAEEAIPFFNELLELEEHNSRFKVIFFVTDNKRPPQKAKRVVSGRIDTTHLKQIIASRKYQQTFFVCGSPSFMDNNTSALVNDLGIPTNKVLSETFAQGKTYSGSLGKYSFTPQKLVYAGTALTMFLGIGFISVLDLSRYLPKVNAFTPTTSSSSSSTITTSTTPSTSSTNNSNTYTSPSNSSSSNSSNYSSNNYVSNYQAPVTSVS